MPRKGPTDRLRNYEIGLDPEHIKQRFEKKRDAMIAKQNDAINKLTSIEHRVGEVLGSEENASVLDLIWYYDFARQVSAVVERLSGGKVVDNEAKALALYWHARGCDLRILNRVLAEVFSLPAAVEK